MSTHLNLHITTVRNQPHAHSLKVAAQKTVLLIALLIGLLSSQEPAHQRTILKKWSDSELFQDIRLRCDSLAFSPTITHLKDNFLTNKRVEDSTLRDIYRTAGLSHLLALSGGQTTPAAYIITTILALSFVTMIKAFLPLVRAHYLPFLFIISYCLELFTLGFLVCLFQATGALSRALSSKSTDLLRLLGHVTAHDRSPSENKSWSTVFELSPWIIVWILHKNPAYDLSFILSLMGAKTAALVSICCARLTRRTGVSDAQSRALDVSKLVINRLAHWVSVTAVTSALMCVFCASLWPIDNVVQKIQGNLIAGPIVLFLVTPASLILLAWITLIDAWPPAPLRNFLELGLSLFHNAALAFSTHSDSQGGRIAYFQPHASVDSWLHHPYLPLLGVIIVLSGIHWFHQEQRTHPSTGRS